MWFEGISRNSKLALRHTFKTKVRELKKYWSEERLHYKELYCNQDTKGFDEEATAD